jgi:hypothetical protein
MASTYSALKIELIATGEQSGTWGTTTNNNLGDAALGEAITGSADVAFSSGDVTVTLTDSNASQAARNLRLNLTGTTGGARSLILGSGCQIEKLYLINNTCADAITVKNTSGTGIAVAAGKSMFVYNNGTNVVEAITQFNGTIALASGVSGVLPIANGGTGTSSTTFTNLTTNVTGTLPIANGGTGSTSTTFVNATTNVTGTLPIANGGTGSTSTTFVNAATNITGTLPVANGGTGASTLTSANVILGAGTSAVTFVAPGSSGNILTSNGSTWTSAAAPAGGFSNIEVFASSGTFTVPAGVTKAKVTVVGGGGNGSAASTNAQQVATGRGRGGGGGGAAIEVVTGLTPAGTVTVTVGGVAGTSSFGAFCSATGGATAVGTADIDSNSYAEGGLGSGGNLNIRGGGGNATDNSTALGGNGGSSIFGGGGSGAQRLNASGGTAGAAGGAYGGGGGGGACLGTNANGAGGAGASGVVIVEY